MMTLSEVAEKFEVSVPAMLGYVRRNLEEINSDGNHAYKHKGDWQFDEIAVERIAKMREASKAELWSNKVKLRKLTKEQKLDLENLQSAFSDLQEKVTTLETQFQNFQATEVQKSELPVDVCAKSVADEERDKKIAILENKFKEFSSDISIKISNYVADTFAAQFNLNLWKRIENKWDDRNRKLAQDVENMQTGKLNTSQFEEELNKFFITKFDEQMEKRNRVPTSWFWLLLIVQIIFFLCCS